jgi:hypothetical protein
MQYTLRVKRYSRFRHGIRHCYRISLTVVIFVAGTHWDRKSLVGPDGGPAVETLLAREVTPFAFAASRVERVHGAEGWKEKVRQLGTEVARTACVEDDQMITLESLPSPAEVALSRSNPQALSMDILCHGPGPAYIAINQTWHPGWRATLDGQPMRLIRTDLALPGVLVSPGKHTMRLGHKDPWLRAGLFISLSAGLACLLLAVRPRLVVRIRRACLQAQVLAGPGSQATETRLECPFGDCRRNAAQLRFKTFGVFPAKRRICAR